MDTAAVKRRGIIYRALTLIAVGLIATAFFLPGWWVALKAPNYPEATFPQGIKILFHMDSVRNGCEIRISEEVEEKEALDCVHEMDTINHYVGMYPIASGGPVEKAFSPYLFGMLGVMLLVFAAPGRKARLAVSLVGYGAVGAWMTLAMFGDNGIKYQTTGYLEGLVVSLGLDSGDTSGDSSQSSIVKMLKQSLEESAAKEKLEVAKSGDRQALISILKANYETDNAKKLAAEQKPWTGSVMQVFKWHYGRSLARWFNEPARNDPLVSMMDAISVVLFVGVIAFMALMIFAAWSADSIFYWALVLIPAALPVGFLAEYAAWLWWYGHSLNAMGAFTLKPFMPTVFGDGKVAQFSTHSYPGSGFGLMVAAAIILVFAALIRRKQLGLAGDAAASM